MKKSILILGAGRMVQAMAFDLFNDFDLTISDINKNALAELAEKFGIKTKLLNVTDKAALTKAVQPFDLIIGAVPGNFGFEMLKTVIEAGKKIVDISKDLSGGKPRNFDKLTKRDQVGQMPYR